MALYLEGKTPLDANDLSPKEAIELAKKAISIRMREITGSNEHTEMRLLRDALKMLRLLAGELRNEMQRSSASRAA